MNNTEKLLRAFIEASGYEIEEVKAEGECYVQGHTNPATGVPRIHKLPATITTDYKVTKKKSFPLDGNVNNLRRSNWE